MCGRPEEKSMLEKIWDGTVDGAGQAFKDTIEGLIALGDLETWQNMGYAIRNWDETIPAMWHVLSDSFKRDIINGDAESRARWGSYALTQLALGLLGDKGARKAGTVIKSAKIPEKVKEAAESLKSVMINDQLAYEGIGPTTGPTTYENPKIKDFLMKIVGGGNKEVGSKDTGNTVKVEYGNQYTKGET